MLVFSRKCNESVVVGDPGGIERTVKVTVLAVKGAKVRLGFEADEDFPIHRWEVWERIRAGARAGPPAGCPAASVAG